jgi:hypothetical protein
MGEYSEDRDDRIRANSEGKNKRIKLAITLVVYQTMLKNLVNSSAVIGGSKIFCIGY